MNDTVDYEAGTMNYEEARQALLALIDNKADCPYSQPSWDEAASGYNYKRGDRVPCVFFSPWDLYGGGVMFINQEGEIVLWYIGEEEHEHHILERVPQEWLDYTGEDCDWRLESWNLHVGPDTITAWVKENGLL